MSVITEPVLDEKLELRGGQVALGVELNVGRVAVLVAIGRKKLLGVAILLALEEDDTVVLLPVPSVWAMAEERARVVHARHGSGLAHKQHKPAQRDTAGRRNQR
eukprot:gnl/Hemi2/10702_TR3670_c0_g9_i1.p3 gnl/Hemi2/10702_TR3670_c0_g9~~gnl/Hemi2/10702_TR3670_c0_g9_i1.p3  ORF type:complete len:104 (+),score=27.76 gnl/Hemi2/10702_TR3670_c0_g9_i1:734-1045(+)